MIDVRDVHKSFGNVHILKGISLHIPNNQTTVILGRSGVGKSVLLRLISGLDTPDSGDIYFGEQSLFACDTHMREKLLVNVGILFQHSALFDSLTTHENIAFPITHNTSVQKRIHATDIDALVEEALAKVGLSGFGHKYPSELSGGQRRRAALARLIVYRPSVLLFDEPTTGLDPITAMHINMLICDTQKALQATCVVVTHDIVTALTVGNYFAFHHDGIIATTGDKETFLQDNNPILRHMLKCATVPQQM